MLQELQKKQDICLRNRHSGQPPINGWGQYAKTVIFPNKFEHRVSSVEHHGYSAESWRFFGRFILTIV